MPAARAGLASVFALVLSMAAPPTTGQSVTDPPASDGPVTQLDEIVVTARRADMPIWEVSDGDSTVILAGAISGVPKDYAWRSDALEAATRRSDRILYPQQGRLSVGDILRLIWRIRTVAGLPADRTTADYLPPDIQARVDTVMADARNESWRRRSLLSLGLDLMEKSGYEQRGYGAADVVRRAARDARIPGDPVGTVRGDDIIDNLITAPPETHAPCIEQAVGAAEVGPAGASARLDDWRARRVPEVLASPLDRALNVCWPSGDADIAHLLRRQWSDAIRAALEQPGVTLAVVQLRVLAEPAGVLDQLQAEDREIIGPDWRAD
ncbi:TraB/GumN family protein [Brevundimonas sp.]|uniref:TraB/GumN family protein n=1 Tax=Brevundimonas sp. TaxID=1871086 RepID=UPI0035AE1FB6